MSWAWGTCRAAVMAALHACRMTSRSFIAQGHDFLRAAVWAAGALDRSDHVPAALRTRMSFYPRGNVCPRATVYAPAPAGAPSGATGSGCAPFSPPARRFLPAWRLPAAQPLSVRRCPPPFRRSRRCVAGRPPGCRRAAMRPGRTGNPSSPAGRRRRTRAAGGAAAPGRPAPTPRGWSCAGCFPATPAWR